MAPNAGAPEAPSMPEPMGNGGALPMMDAPQGPDAMPMDEPMDGGDNQFDSNFDPGVEANEETDPKKFIQQLTGKLSQSLRNYNNDQPQPDAELNKYVAGMIIKQCVEGLSQNDVQEILSKLKKDDEENIENEEMPQQDMDNNEMPMDNTEPMPPMNENASVRDKITNRYNELTGENANGSSEKVTDRGSYHKRPWVGKTFKS